MDYFFVIRILLALLVGFWVARYFRAPIRGLVIRLMPIKYRMSEQSFHLQSRISTGLAILIALAIGFVVNQGLSRALQLVEGRWWDRTESIEAFSMPLEPASPPPEPELEPLPEPEPQANPHLVPETEKPETTIPKAYGPAPEATAPVGSYYLQAGAFDKAENAWRYHYTLSRRFPGRAHLGEQAGRYCPHKVLLGPFPSRRAVRSFRGRHGLEGFPRTLQELQLVD